MEPDDVKRPGHEQFIFLASLFLSIFGILSYILLTFPFYYHVFFGVVVFLIKKYYYCNGEKDSTFDLLKKSQGTKVNICVVGAGFSGLCMGVKLKNAGIKFQILEKDSEVGGTWSANRYPGCRCDVWSVLYQVRNYKTKFDPRFVLTLYNVIYRD